MSAHTPGPWTLAKSPDGEQWAMSGTTWVAKLSRATERGVNARLIAAAPEMLEALEEAEPHIRGLGSAHALAAVRAAIAKAKGDK